MSGTTRETTMLAQADEPGRRYLGSPEQAHGLFAEYVAGMVLRAADAGRKAAAGDLGAGQKAAAEDQKAAAALIEVLAGRDPDWVPLGGWNANETGGLRSWLRHMLSEAASPAMLAREPDGPIEALVAHMMHRTYQALAEMQDGKSEDDLRADIVSIIGEGLRLSLGLPPDHEFEGGAAAD